MTRQAFMARLLEGLRGLPPRTQADIVADYNVHFNEGLAAGRSEADVDVPAEITYTQAPGPGNDGLLAKLECEKALTMAMARAGSSRAAPSRASLTFIGYAVPSITRPSTRPPL